jgi:hypothetical protein
MKKRTEKNTEEQVKRLAKALKMPLLVATKIPFNRMNEYYNKCKIFVSLPPVDAGFNLCWFEAMAAEVPMVIGNNEGAGIKLPIKKVEKIGEIEKIKFKSDGKFYRKWLKGKYTWKNQAKRLIEVISKENS